MNDQLKRAAEVLREYAAMIEESEVHRSGPLKGRCAPKIEAEITEYRALAHALEAPQPENAPTELQVQAGAVILATTPLIDAPKLSHNAWMGLSRSILEAAYAARR